jgi:hypothetical protein
VTTTCIRIESGRINMPAVTRITQWSIRQVVRAMSCPPLIPDRGDVPASLSDQDFEALWDLFEEPLPRAPDLVILRIVRALARQAAREDHARETRD